MENNNKIKDEALRYLGYKGQKMDRLTDELIYETMLEIESLIRERHIYELFHIDREGIDTEDQAIKLKGSSLNLCGKDIKEHLKDSESCILMALTLGHDLDTRIRYYEKTSMTKALILDAYATAFTEKFCDDLCREIESKLPLGKALTSRYSPGYGDLAISIQGDFLSTLNAEKAIGLTASSHSILIPRKSVTAIVGVINREDKKEELTCLSCSKYEDCTFRKGGNICGH